MIYGCILHHCIVVNSVTACAVWYNHLKQATVTHCSTSICIPAANQRGKLSQVCVRAEL